MAKLLRKIAAAIIFTNLFLAAAVTSLVFETYIILFGTITDYKYPFFLFCSTLFLYCFHRVYRFNHREKEEKFAKRHQWVEENKILFYTVMILAAAGVAWALIFFVNTNTILCLLPIGLVSVAYTVPLVPSQGKWIRLRDVPGIKIFLISIVLGLTTVLLPILSGNDLTVICEPAILFVFFRRVLFIFAITVPFDIRDIDYDMEKKIKTLPIILGIKRSKIVAIIALSLFILLGLIQYLIYYDTSLYYMIALFVSAIISGVIISQTDTNKEDFFYSFYVEGMMMLQCLLILAAHKF